MRKFLAVIFSLCLFSYGYGLDFSNLEQCIEDVKQAAASPPKNEVFFTKDYNQLMKALSIPQMRETLPKVYQDTMFDPFLSYLEKIGVWGFNSIFIYQANNPQYSFYRQIIPDIAEAILQSGYNYAQKASNAFQEVVNDLYKSFLSEENRVSNETGVPIKMPDKGVVPPLVKWGNPDFGPYTWPVDATSEIKVKSAVVNLPPANLQGGLLAWATLPHETVGHDILHADTGLIDELGNKVFLAVLNAFPGDYFLANYWRQCIDETASDVLGLLNAGPVAGISLIGYFRGLTDGSLRNIGALPPTDTHPVDILRGVIAARVIERMSFSQAGEWSSLIRKEVNKDLDRIYLVDVEKQYYYPIDHDKAIQSAELVSDVISDTKLHSLEGHSLKEIQDWTDSDQKIVDELGMMMRKGEPLSSDYKNSGYFAVHVIASAIQEALKAGTNVQYMFDRMIDFLAVMHAYNDVWNPSAGSVCTCECSCDCCQKCQEER